MVTAVDVYKEIRRMQLEGESSQRQVAKELGISRNTVKKYWNGESVPWEKKEYTRATTVLTEEVLRFIKRCIDWMDSRHFTSKEMVEVLEQCLSVGYKAVMQHHVFDTPVEAIKDEVKVDTVDLREYDHLCSKEVSAS